jgi:hypothetical protein
MNHKIKIIIFTVTLSIVQSLSFAQSRVPHAVELAAATPTAGFTPPYSIVLVAADWRANRPECIARVVPALYSIDPRMSGKTLAQITSFVERELAPSRARELAVSIQAIIAIYNNYSYKNVIVPLAIKKLELALIQEVRHGNLPTENLKNTVLQQLRTIVNFYTAQFENEMNDSTSGGFDWSVGGGVNNDIGSNNGNNGSGGWSLGDWCSNNGGCDDGGGSVDNIARITRNNSNLNTPKTIKANNKRN